MKNIPRLSAVDSTKSFLGDPYEFITKKCDQLGTDIFEMRLLLQKTICMRGPEAAQFFYSDAFIRRGAAPGAVLATLLGNKGVQTLDHDQHRHRKKLFMDLMQENNLQRLDQITRKNWRVALHDWKNKHMISFYDELHLVLTKSVCEWFGVPLKSNEIQKRTKDLMAMFDAAGAKNVRHLKARLSRKRSERWMTRLVNEIRSTGETTAPGHLETFALFKDVTGELLPDGVAAVEILNVLRPTVAVSLFMVFLAHALHAHPDEKSKLLTEKDKLNFIQEVRRLYPFFPTAMAVVKEDVTWKGMRLEKETRVLLDLYATNLDRRTWRNPRRFDPARFNHWEENAFDFIPQGGGDHYQGHRCPGEWITLHLMKLALDMLTEEMSYTVPPQNLGLELTRLPALVKSRFIMRNVSPLKTLSEENAHNRRGFSEFGQAERSV